MTQDSRVPNTLYQGKLNKAIRLAETAETAEALLEAYQLALEVPGGNDLTMSLMDLFATTFNEARRRVGM